MPSRGKPSVLNTPRSAPEGENFSILLLPYLPATVHIESSRTAIRLRFEIFADTLQLSTDGTWEEHSTWRVIDYQGASPVATLSATTGQGTFVRDVQNRLVITAAAAAGGFLSSIPKPDPAPIALMSDTLLVPSVNGVVVWDPRFVRVR